ncbi:MAG: hypothetical protein JWR83_2735, partial [Aeromicrobium sp.]|nr:hypothetical protein [Aeromicrobium sp.]
LTFAKQKKAGKVKVTVDGKSTTIDLYSATAKSYSKTYKFAPAATSSHSVTITVLGTKSSKSKGTNVYISKFAVAK